MNWRQKVTSRHVVPVGWSSVKKPWRRRLCCEAGIFLLMSIAWFTRMHWLPAIGSALHVSDPLAYAPLVFILPGSEETRPCVAARLMKAGYADRAIIPETRPHSDVLASIALSTSDTTRQLLIQQGLTDAVIVTLPGASESTLGDAIALDKYFQQSGVTDVILVTNAYHSRRARWAFQRVLPQHRHRLRIYTAPNGFDERSWWTTRRGRYCVLSEWMKYSYYLIRYGHGWVWCLVLTILGGAIVFTRLNRKESENGRVRTSAQSR